MIWIIIDDVFNEIYGVFDSLKCAENELEIGIIENKEMFNGLTIKGPFPILK